jgi:hypothetical protein
MALVLKSDTFVDGEAIPSRYTCEGEDCSPPLSWANLPEGTRSLVLIVDDPDAPDPAAPRMVWDHWILYNIPPECGGLPEDAARHGLPEGTGRGSIAGVGRGTADPARRSGVTAIFIDSMRWMFGYPRPWVRPARTICWWRWTITSWPMPSWLEPTKSPSWTESNSMIEKPYAGRQDSEVLCARFGIQGRTWSMRIWTSVSASR